MSTMISVLWSFYRNLLFFNFIQLQLLVQNINKHILFSFEL